MQEHLDYLTKQVNEDPELALFTLIETLDKNLNIQEAEHCLGLLDKLFELTVDREFAIEITKLKIEYTRKFIEWHFQNDESIWRSFLKRFPDDKEAWRQFLDICEDAAYLSFFPSDIVRVLKEDKNQLRSYLLLKQARLYLCCDLSETMLQRWNKRVKDWVALAIQLDSEARYVWSEIFDELDWEERQEDMKLFTAQVDVEN